MLSATLLGLGYLALPGPERAVLPRPEASPGSQPADRAADAAALLEELEVALVAGEGLTGLAAPGLPQARRELADLAANVRRLGVSDLDLRYVDERAGAVPSGRPGPSAWVADVALRWRLAGYDGTTSRMEVTMTFAERAGRVGFVSARADHGQRAPLWLLDRVEVRRGPRRLVVTAGAPAGEYAPLVRRALVDVAAVLPRWRGSLVVEVPTGPDQLERVLAADEGEYDAIAAVTTTADGSREGAAAVRVYLNRAVFDPLGRRGAQIVMSHEAAHVATAATLSSTPTWLLEGFADYVALARVDLPVEVTASQILAQVREQGPPRALPGPDQFGTHSPGLGAAYEASWLACRLIAETEGRRALIRFYRRADAAGTKDAFATVLGTTEAEFTRRWRVYLRDLAG